MGPDIDIFIRSQEDPLLFLVFHRHFTHSLFFIPFGGLICALIFHWLVKRFSELTFRQTLLYCTIGYGTHGFIDACTSYGTKLYWPFSEERVAFNVIAVIDPLFTVPLLLMVIIAVIAKRPFYARLGLGWAVFYLVVALVQHESALARGAAIAEARGHEPVRLEAKPSFANVLVWKIVYETENAYFVDAVRVGYKPKDFLGQSVPKLDVAKDFPWLDPSSQQAIDIERFRHFSDDFLALDPDDPSQVIDLRYSILPNTIDPLWTIQLDPAAGPEDHVAYLTHRGNASTRLDIFADMLFADDF